MKFLIDLSSNNNYLIKNHVLRKSYFFKPLLDYLPNVVHVCVCVVLSKFQNGKNSRHEKEGPSVIRLEFSSNYKLKWNKN